MKQRKEKNNLSCIWDLVGKCTHPGELVMDCFKDTLDV